MGVCPPAHRWAVLTVGTCSTGCLEPLTGSSPPPGSACCRHAPCSEACRRLQLPWSSPPPSPTLFRLPTELPTRDSRDMLLRVGGVCDTSGLARRTPSGRSGRRPSSRLASEARADSTDEPLRVPRRRAALAIGEALLELSVACWCELAFRPKAPGDEAMTLRESVRSLAPQRTPEAQKSQALAALARGQALAAQGDHAAAVLEFTTVLQKAPRDWKLSQAALGGRNQSRRALGEGGEDGRQQWLWGRGVRFPGHYILAYILARRAFVPPYDEQVKLDKRAQQTQGFVELLAIAVLAGVYNYVLLVYGLEY